MTSIPSLMPPWVRHFPLLLAVAALPFTWLVTALSIRFARSGEPVPAEPWYARARVLWPQQMAARRAQLLAPTVLMALVPLARGPATATPAWLVVLVTFPCSMIGASFAVRAFFASHGVRRPALAHLRAALGGMLVNGLPLWLAALGAYASWPLSGAARLAVMGAFLVAVPFAAAGMGVYLSRAVGLLSAARPELARAAEAAAAASGHRPRFVWEADVAVANALALPWLQGVLVMRRLLEIASPEEVEAILRHELGHLREPWAMRIARLGLPVLACWTVVLLPAVALSPAPLLGALAWVAALLWGLVLLRRWSRRMEHRADEELGADHPAYARALEKLYQDNLLPAVTGEKRLTHPELYDRMIAAGHPPAWPRPEPPKQTRLGRVVLVAALVIPLELAACPFLFRGPALEARPEWEVVLDGGRGGALFGVARGWLKEDRREQARALLLALAAEDTSEFAATSAAGILAEGGFCDDADRLAGERQLLDGESRWSGWLTQRLRDCSDGQVLVRDVAP